MVPRPMADSLEVGIENVTEVVAEDGRTIGVGTHERRVIDVGVT